MYTTTTLQHTEHTPNTVELLCVLDRGALLSMTLTRPSALNAITTEMCAYIAPLLTGTHKALLVQGQQGRVPAFCAGGDVKALWTATKAGQPLTDFFRTECKLP